MLYMHEGSVWWMLFGWLWITLFWVSVVSIAIWIVRRITWQSRLEESRLALEIARSRYARGEISRAEFEQIIMIRKVGRDG